VCACIASKRKLFEFIASNEFINVNKRQGQDADRDGKCIPDRKQSETRTLQTEKYILEI